RFSQGRRNRLTVRSAASVDTDRTRWTVVDDRVASRACCRNRVLPQRPKFIVEVELHVALNESSFPVLRRRDALVQYAVLIAVQNPDLPQRTILGSGNLMRAVRLSVVV